MGVPVVDESNWKRRHWPPKQLLVLSFVTADSARAPVAVSVSRRRAVSMLQCCFGALCASDAVVAGARGQSAVWEQPKQTQLQARVVGRALATIKQE